GAAHRERRVHLLLATGERSAWDAERGGHEHDREVLKLALWIDQETDPVNGRGIANRGRMHLDVRFGGQFDALGEGCAFHGNGIANAWRAHLEAHWGRRGAVQHEEAPGNDWAHDDNRRITN